MTKIQTLIDLNKNKEKKETIEEKEKKREGDNEKQNKEIKNEKIDKNMEILIKEKLNQLVFDEDKETLTKIVKGNNDNKYILNELDFYPIHIYVNSFGMMVRMMEKAKKDYEKLEENKKFVQLSEKEQKKLINKENKEKEKKHKKIIKYKSKKEELDYDRAYGNMSQEDYEKNLKKLHDKFKDIFTKKEKDENDYEVDITMKELKNNLIRYKNNILLDKKDEIKLFSRYQTYKDFKEKISGNPSLREKKIDIYYFLFNSGKLFIPEDNYIIKKEGEESEEFINIIVDIYNNEGKNFYKLLEDKEKWENINKEEVEQENNKIKGKKEKDKNKNKKEDEDEDDEESDDSSDDSDDSSGTNKKKKKGRAPPGSSKEESSESDDEDDEDEEDEEDEEDSEEESKKDKKQKKGILKKKTQPDKSESNKTKSDKTKSKKTSTDKSKKSKKSKKTKASKKSESKQTDKTKSKKSSKKSSKKHSKEEEEDEEEEEEEEEEISNDNYKEEREKLMPKRKISTEKLNGKVKQRLMGEEPKLKIAIRGKDPLKGKDTIKDFSKSDIDNMYFIIENFQSYGDDLDSNEVDLLDRVLYTNKSLDKYYLYANEYAFDPSEMIDKIMSKLLEKIQINFSRLDD